MPPPSSASSISPRVPTACSAAHPSFMRPTTARAPRGRHARRQRSWGNQPICPVAPSGFDHSVDWTRLERMSWKDVRNELAARPARFRDRLVLVGATYAGSGDNVRLSSRSGEVAPGFILQALVVESILAGFPVRDTRRWPILIAIGLAAATVTSGILCLPRLSPALLLGFVVLFAHAAAAVIVFVRSQSVLPIAGPLATIALLAVVALVFRRLVDRRHRGGRDDSLYFSTPWFEAASGMPS